MRNPLRSIANVAVALVATVALAPLFLSPTSAFARGGGGGGGRGGRGGNPGGSGGSPGGRGGTPGGRGGTGPSSGGRGSKSGSKGNQAAGQAAKNNPMEYLLMIQQDDSDDHRADFLVDALDEATVNQRDKDRAAALAANREAASKVLRADDMPKP